MEFKQNTLERQVTRFTVTKAKSLEHGQFEAIISTDDLDRHGEHVSIKGLQIPKDQVIKMYYNHETNGTSLPIGKWLDVKKKDGKLVGTGEVDLEDDFALKVYKKILKGYIDSISVSFYPLEYDGDTSTWTKSTLVEASVVAEPANTRAVITAKDLGFDNKEFEKSLEKKLEEVISDTEDGGDVPELKAALELLKSRVGALEEAHEAANENPATKQLIKIRVAAKEVDKAADDLNKVIRIKLKEKSNA